MVLVEGSLLPPARRDSLQDLKTHLGSWPVAGVLLASSGEKLETPLQPTGTGLLPARKNFTSPDVARLRLQNPDLEA